MDDDEELTENEQEMAQLVRAVGSERIDWMTPPAGLWSRIEIDLDHERGSADDVHDVGADPGLDSGGGQGSTPSPRRLSRRSLVAALGGGIAAGIAIGALGGGLLGRGGLDQGETRTLRRAELRTLTTDQLLGQAVLREQGEELFLQIVANEPIEYAAGIVEVWLINLDGQRMVSVGVYQGVESARFPVPEVLLQQGFVLVDLSRELLDGDNNHSGDSIVRGELS